MNLNSTTKSLLAGAAIAGILSGGLVAKVNAASVTKAESRASPPGCSPKQEKGETHDCAGRTPARARAVARPATTAAKAKTPAKAKAAARKDGKPVRARKVRPHSRRAPSRAAGRACRSGAPQFSASCVPHSASTCLRTLQQISPTTASASACASRITGTFSQKKPVVDWFEIISENFMVDGGRPLEVLDQILEQYRSCSTACRCISARPTGSIAST